MRSPRLPRWLRSLHTNLSQRLTPSGWALLTIGLVASLQGSISLDIPTYHIGSFAAVTLSLAWLISLVTPPNVQLTRHPLKPVIAGTTIQVDIDIHNRSRHSAYQITAMEQHLPPGLILSDDIASPILPRLGPYATARLPLHIHCPKRGIYRLSGLYAASDFPLGLCRGIRRSRQETVLVVYPTPLLPAEFNDPVRLLDATDHYHARSRPSESTEFLYTREYSAGDNPRHLHWASWARTGTPAVKVFQRDQAKRVVFVLDTAVLSAREETDFETAVSVLAGMGVHLAQQGYLIEPLLAGNPISQLPGNSPQPHIAPFLERLAGLTPTEATNWADIAATLTSALSPAHHVRLVTLDWSIETARFVNYFQARCFRIQATVVRSAPTSHPIPDLTPAVTHYQAGGEAMS